ncbi:helix-turn-helix domain-containing protein [Nocardioides sp. LHD-245]|uniref:PucR family transcriptional regulator n=1 Tax=Nocardioides sp. LHD-245 TaxID=3051387 RepID=UPI0027E18373|nr:helix-turn-helix domain-containing protein [Nocardioides sp. LHD-245]
MILLRDLLVAGDRLGLAVLAGTTPSGSVLGVRLAEDTGALTGDLGGALVMVPPAASGRLTRAGDYQLDLFLRQCSTLGVAGIVIADDGSGLTPTASVIAERFRVCVLGYSTDTDFSTLMLRLVHVVDGEADGSWLDEFTDVLEELVEAPQIDARTVLSRLSTLSDRRLELGPGGDVELAGGGRLASGVRDRACVLSATALLRVIAATFSELPSPVRSRAAVLHELVTTESDPPQTALDLAAAVGLDLQAWHTGAVVDGSFADDDPLASYVALDQLHREMTLWLDANTDGWSSCVAGRSVILVHSQRLPSSSPNPGQRAAELTDCLHSMADRGKHARGAIGLCRAGVEGLRRSTAEARATLATRGPSAVGGIVMTDADGLARVLLDVATSTTSGLLVNELLAPLDALGGDRARTSIETLAVYLKCHRSLKRTAEELHLHRNAVVYRMRRITEALGDDLTDPERRFALELACRVRRLSAP